MQINRRRVNFSRGEKTKLRLLAKEEKVSNSLSATPENEAKEKEIERIEVEETVIEPAPDEYGFLEGTMTYKLILILAAIAIALVSFLVIAPIASNPDTHAQTISELDEKKDTVMLLIAGSTASSAAITAIPDDVGTPIAEKLMDLSGDFLVVLTAIYLEKYLLTIFGMAAFNILIPLACLCFIIAVAVRDNPALKKASAKLAAKLTLFGLAIFIVVPVSVVTSNMIEQTYSTSVDNIVAMADETVSQAEEVSEETSSQDEGILSLLKPVQDKIDQLTQQAQNTVNGFIEALAVMIVTSCIIPVLVLVFFLWLVKMILGVNIDVPMQILQPKAIRHITKKIPSKPAGL